MNSGTYAAESGGRLQLAGTFTNWISIEPWTGNAGDVTVQDSGTTGGSVIVRANSVSNIQFNGLTIAGSPTGRVGFHFWPANGSVAASGLHFVNCTFPGTQSSSVSYCGVNLDNAGSADGTLVDLAFIGCNFPVTGSGSRGPVLFAARPAGTTPGSQPFQQVGFFNCSTPTFANWSDFSSGAGGIATFTSLGCRWSLAGIHAFLIGHDASGASVPNCSDILISGGVCETNNAGGHAILVGENCQNAIVDSVNVNGSMHGIVVKGATGTMVRNCTVSVFNPVGLDALYSKASSGTTFYNNTVTISGQNQLCYCLREYYDSASGVRDGGLTVTNNLLIADGPNERLMTWDKNASCGGSEDYNAYALRHSAAWGAFRGANVSSLLGLQTSWSKSALSGDNLQSDANSTVVP